MLFRKFFNKYSVNIIFNNYKNYNLNIKFEKRQGKFNTINNDRLNRKRYFKFPSITQRIRKCIKIVL